MHTFYLSLIIHYSLPSTYLARHLLLPLNVSFVLLSFLLPYLAGAYAPRWIILP
jgi:hypothetical protein